MVLAEFIGYLQGETTGRKILIFNRHVFALTLSSPYPDRGALSLTYFALVLFFIFGLFPPVEDKNGGKSFPANMRTSCAIAMFTKS